MSRARAWTMTDQALSEQQHAKEATVDASGAPGERKTTATTYRAPQRARRASTGRAALPRQSEASWQATVLQYATLRGWRPWHDQATNAPRRCAECGAYRRGPRNAAGWLDLVLVRRPQLIFAELKREGEGPTVDQQTWIDELRACGQDVRIWRPSDWPEVEMVLW